MTEDKIQWHPGFVGGIELALRKYKSELTFVREYPLSKKPLQIDVLIIKKNDDTKIETSFGRIFSTHNVIEYKNPEDGLNVDDYFKTLGYACLYKSLSRQVNGIKSKKLSISLFRDVLPKKLLKELKKLGAKIQKKYKGVYYITGTSVFPTQIVVISELDDPDSLSLKMLSKKAKENDIINFTEFAKSLREKDDRENADAVLQVSLTANRALFDEMKRRDPDMFDALMTFMKPEIDEKVQEGMKEGRKEGRREGIIEGRKEGIQEGSIQTLASLVNKGLISLSDAAREANLTLAEFQEKMASFTAKN